jgi:D-alanyl-D-alanine carboxypeptidase
MTVNNTFVLGSPTKTFSAAAVMKLVDQGKVTLEDKAHVQIDKVMTQMWNKTLANLFGPKANDITIGHLIRMQSGLNDLERGEYEHQVLFKETVHDPLEDLMEVANYTEPWAFAPGEGTMYSSTNFLLTGLFLISH